MYGALRRKRWFLIHWLLLHLRLLFLLFTLSILLYILPTNFYKPDHDGQFTSTVTQRARWIKYEEDLEAEVGRWGKPQVPSLTFHSLINLRLYMESGTLLLDISARDLPELLHRVVEDLSEKGIIEEDQKAKVLRVLLYRHKHVQPHTNTFKFGLKRSMSQRSIQGLLDDGRKASIISKGSKSQDDMVKQDDNFNNMENGFTANKDEDHLVLDMTGAHGGLKRNTSQGSFKTNESFDNLIKARMQL